MVCPAQVMVFAYHPLSTQCRRVAPLQCPTALLLRILHVGRFERAKGVETLVKSFVELSKNLKNIELINIGQARGPSLKICMDFLEKENLKLAKNILNNK